jgi:hypothetical protein
MKTLPSLFVLALVACSSAEPTGNTANIPDGASDGQAVLSDASVDAETAPDSSSVDAGPVDKAARCASTFGSGLTKPFGRLDGIVRAVVPPAHPTCPQPNGTHLILQLDAGQPLETYRVVVNVASDRAGDARVRFRAFEHPSLAPWVDGWHGNTPLDYVRDLGLQSEATGFAPMEQAALVQTVTDPPRRVGLGLFVDVRRGEFSFDPSRRHREQPGWRPRHPPAWARAALARLPFRNPNVLIDSRSRSCESQPGC